VGALKVDYLKAILTVHGKKPVGKKEDLQDQVRSLLDDKTPDGVDQATAIAEMRRLAVAAAAARMVNDRPLLLGPTEAPTLAAPPLLMGPSDGPGDGRGD